MRSARIAAAVGTILLSPHGAIGQHSAPPMTGRQIYTAACVNCHGSDGRGVADSIVGFPEELPDFTDCSFASREAAADWYAVVHQGGPVRAFSRRMPAFGKALTSDQIERVVDYVLDFCKDKSWPRGELNLPRATATEKAFPEDETVLTMNAVTERGAREFTSTLVYERRIGSQTQWEVAIPVGIRELTPGGGWTGPGLGDIQLAIKRTLLHSGRGGYILSAGMETILPTGSTSKGFGSGATIFEPFVLAAKTLPRDAFLQFHGGAEFPSNERNAEREVFGRFAFGATFGPEFGRAFTPMVEFLAARGLEADATTETDWIPQIQISLSKRQHILANIGVRLPVSDRSTRPRQLVAYILWDWFDGGFLDGWR
jgi:hypothetical protein